ncbi:WBSCR27 [Branchiostoma lanceolatum]|uniref:WBSCR27 protein n=1 Tax=Branchiostoma lanceolatum TaxID=7740 RepID=A0A8K0EVS2_BRALA|nr:WBSCR27 [Branchiostoma lanceolatum]
MTSHKDDVYRKVWSVQHPGITTEESQRFYSTWAPAYDKDLTTEIYNGPRQIAEALAGVVGDRKDARILDAAAGTGLVGEELRKLGFSNMDALDANKEMLDIAESKKVYRNLIHDLLGPNRLQIADDTYDALCCSGSFSDGHLKCDCLEEMIRVVTPGGVICLIVKEAFLETVEEYKRLEPRMSELQDKGLWERTSRIVAEEYVENGSGIIFVYKVL